MPEEQVQVAEPEAPLAETPEAQVQETQSKVAAEPVAEKPQGKTEAEWQAELERSNARYESMLGNERKRQQTETALAALMAQQKELVKFLTNPDADREDLKRSIEGITEESARSVMEHGIRDAWHDDVGVALREAGMRGDEPELAEANTLWFSGDKEEKLDLKLCHQGYVEANRVIRKKMLADKANLEANHKKELEMEKRRANQAEGVLEVGIPDGIPGGSGMSWAQAQQIKKVSDLSDEAYEKLVARR